ncbi:MAG: FCD domain-containing protein [Pseudomonadota bacterium]
MPLGRRVLPFKEVAPDMAFNDDEVPQGVGEGHVGVGQTKVAREARRGGPTVAELRAALESMVASGRVLPPERQLVEDLAVPRSRLRKVLAEMRADGDLPPAQVGRRATQPSTPQVNDFVRITNPTDVIELRLILEPQFARLAAIRASAMQSARIMKAATTAPDSGYGAADMAFHLEVASASRNALGRELYALLRKIGADSRMRLSRRRELSITRRAERDVEHMEIARAIASRDPEAAEEAMRAHLAKVQSLILERMSPDPSEPAPLKLVGAAE